MNLIDLKIEYLIVGNARAVFPIRTDSYPQIIHKPSWNATGGVITCNEFVDINGKRSTNGISAILLF